MPPDTALLPVAILDTSTSDQTSRQPAGIFDKLFINVNKKNKKINVKLDIRPARHRASEMHG